MILDGLIGAFFMLSAFFFVMAIRAHRHQRTAHIDSAPRCARYADTIDPERKEAVRQAWEELAEVESPLTPWQGPTVPPPVPAKIDRPTFHGAELAARWHQPIPPKNVGGPPPPKMVKVYSEVAGAEVERPDPTRSTYDR